MARTASIIMSKSDKKAALAEMTLEIREIKQQIKGADLAIKDADKRLKLATKEHASEVKLIEKDIARYNKALAMLEAQKSALANDPSASAPVVRAATAAVVTKPVTEVKTRARRRTKAEMEAARAAAAA